MNLQREFSPRYLAFYTVSAYVAFSVFIGIHAHLARKLFSASVASSVKIRVSALLTRKRVAVNCQSPSALVTHSVKIQVTALGILRAAIVASMVLV